MRTDPIKRLNTWFLAQRRDLPWRENPSPYAVWVSEVMLQQTQVSVVIPYFERWMQQFPTIRDLAKASLEQVLKEWEGLGYYSRARYLHEGARYVVEYFGGELPASEDSLKKVKGLGPYTRGAILSFAFHQRKAAVDGNVLRVLARYYCIEENIAKSHVLKKIQQFAEELLSEKEPWITAEALIELGAIVCTKIPKCKLCPLRESCQGYAKGKAELLPTRPSRTATTLLYRAVAVVFCDNHLLIRNSEKGKVMGDLCEFPYFEMQHVPTDDVDVSKLICAQIPLPLVWKEKLLNTQHSFTRYRAHLFPHLFMISAPQTISNCDWVEIDHLKKRAFSSGHRHIFANFQQWLSDACI